MRAERGTELTTVHRVDKVEAWGESKVSNGKLENGVGLSPRGYRFDKEP